MKEVELYGGTIDSCLERLREMAAADESGEVLKAVFNDKYLLSTDSDDDAYLRITGKTKAEHDEYMRKWREDYEARRKAHEARVRKVTGHTAEQIAAGHPKPIADAIQLLLTVGIIDAGKVYADICWDVCLEQATAAIQQRIADLQTETVSKDCADIRQYIGKLIVLNYDRESCLAFVEGIEKCSDGKEYADFCNIVGSSWGLRMDSDFTFRPATDLDLHRAVIDRCKEVAESYGYKF